MEKQIKISKKAVIKMEPFSRAQVQIIIPFHGQYNKVTKLVESIVDATKSNPYQIYLVDDGSLNSKFIETIKESYLCKAVPPFAPQCICIRNQTQKGFGASLFEAFNICTLPWVLFMHSDCVVEDPRWLIELGKTALDHYVKGSLALVSAKSNNPCSEISALKGERQDRGEDIVLKEGSLPMYCTLAHRDLFKRCGFIKPYPYALYEDEEFAYRMRKYDCKQVVCGKSWIRHDGGSTIETVCKENPGAKEVMEANRDLCVNDIRNLYK